MPVNARRFVKKLRGGAQSHLIECDDGHFYIVKFRNNPQHRRILINEMIAGQFLKQLQLAAPPTVIVNLSPAFIAENPDVHIQLGSRRIAAEPGWHFGSRHPKDPSKLAVYDFVPDVLLEKVSNLRDFAGMVVFDKWVGNADARQAVFFRARLRELGSSLTEHPNKLGLVAQMIDHGYILDGPHWNFNDSPLQGLYFRPIVYQSVRGLDDFQPWLDRVTHFPEEIIDYTLKQIPPDWVGDDHAALDVLMGRLLERRKRVPDLIEECRKSRINPFPNWR